MAIIDTNSFRKGVKIEYEGAMWEIVDYQRSKMAQRSPVVKTKLRNIITGAVQEVNFRSGETFNIPDLERRNLQFLYKDNIGYHFMDSQNYEQYAFDEDQVGDSARFLKEQLEVISLFHEDRPIGIELPTTVELEVTETDPGLKGDTVSSTNKPAKVETGTTIAVPLFVEIGDIVKIDTRTGAYIGRTKKA